MLAIICHEQYNNDKKEGRYYPVLIDNIHIQNVNGIKDVHISFNKGVNILCGTNGVGKSTVLYAIMGAFSLYTHKMTLSADSDGEGIVTVTSDGNSCTYFIKNRTVGNNYTTTHNYENKNFITQVRNICFFKPHRDIPENNPEAIPQLKKEDDSYYMRLTSGVDAGEIKGWFQNKFLFAETTNKHSKLSGASLNNYNAAIDCFGALDPEINFSHVDSGSHEIFINTRRGRISLNSLSSGYQSALYILLGLIHTIEKLSPDNGELYCIDTFNGIILIDEIDVHLHPQWQVSFVNTLKRLAPKAQIITTTHSASVIQNADPGEIITLAFDETGNVIRKDVPNSTYGYKGWTLEEVFTDVMGMESTRSQEYIDAENAFNAALQSGDYVTLESQYQLLLKMLHPRSHVRKILEVQMAGMR